MHFLDEGDIDAEPVVMVHGNPTWSYFFRQLVSALAPSHRVVVPDHIGMGLSEKPAEENYPYTLEQRVRDLEELLEGLQIRRPINLVVHDWGGSIGLGYAGRHPEKVGRLVILNTAAFRLPAGKRVPWQLLACRIPILGAIMVRGLNGFCEYAARFCVRQPMAAETRQAYLAPYGSWRTRLAVLRFVEDIPLSPSHPSYRTLCEVEAGLSRLASKPVLLCWGLKDFVFDEDYLDQFLQRFPDAQVHREERAGHYLLEDAPKSCAAVIREFLRRSPEHG